MLSGLLVVMPANAPGRGWLLVANLGIVNVTTGKVAAVDESGAAGHEVNASPNGDHMVAIDLASRKVTGAVNSGRRVGPHFPRANEERHAHVSTELSSRFPARSRTSPSRPTTICLHFRPEGVAASRDRNSHQYRAHARRQVSAAQGQEHTPRRCRPQNRGDRYGKLTVKNLINAGNGAAGWAWMKQAAPAASWPSAPAIPVTTRSAWAASCSSPDRQTAH